MSPMPITLALLVFESLFVLPGFCSLPCPFHTRLNLNALWIMVWDYLSYHSLHFYNHFLYLDVPTDFSIELKSGLLSASHYTNWFAWSR